MKKYVIGIICLVSMFLFPISVFAESYSLTDTDITIDIPNDWYVFTRDNIKGNFELEKLQIDYDYMKNLFESNYAYMDAFIVYDTGMSVELFVRVKENDAITNLSNYSDEDVMSLSKELAEKQSHNNYDIYVEDYKFAVSKYKQQGLHLIEYYTIVNGYGYTLTIQKTAEYTSDEKTMIEEIIDTIVFDVDKSLKEPNRETSVFDGIIDWAINGVLIGGAVGAVVGLIVLLKNKKEKFK